MSCFAFFRKYLIGDIILEIYGIIWYTIIHSSGLKGFEGEKLMIKIFKNAFAIIAAAALVIAIIFGYMSISTITSTTYEYYEDQYYECSSGYSKCMSSANSTSNAIYKAAYKNMANEYRSLMKTWKNRMEELEEQATILGIISGVSLATSVAFSVLAAIKIKKAKANELEIAAADVPGIELPIEPAVEAPVEVATVESEE